MWDSSLDFIHFFHFKILLTKQLHNKFHFLTKKPCDSPAEIIKQWKKPTLSF